MARANDDELVFPYLDHLKETGELDKKSRAKPSMEGYTNESERLDRLTLAVHQLTATVASALSGKKQDTPSIPLPESSRDRWEGNRRQSYVSGIFAEVAEAQQRWIEREQDNT